MAEEEEISIFEKIKGKFKDRPIRPSTKVEKYVNNNLPKYIDEYRLAKRSDLNGIDKKVEKFMGELDKLDHWQSNTKKRVEEDKRKVKRLKKKIGLEEGE